MKKKMSMSASQDDFLFVGNHVFLDFINTRPEVDGTPKELLHDWSSLLSWFRAAELISARDGARFERRWAHSSEARKTLKAIRDFREELRTDVLAWESSERVRGETVQRLNHLMACHPMLTRVRWAEGRLVTAPSFPLEHPSDLFAPLASAAANLFSELDPARVRKCEHCVLHFHDTSKIGSRRWCSMSLCGNRAKVAAYAARQRATNGG